MTQYRNSLESENDLVIKSKEVDEHGDWCFVASFNNEKIKIPISKLPVVDKFDCNECLLTGIGMVLSEYKLIKHG